MQTIPGTYALRSQSTLKKVHRHVAVKHPKLLGLQLHWSLTQLEVFIPTDASSVNAVSCVRLLKRYQEALLDQLRRKLWTLIRWYRIFAAPLY
jgi:hypothetical protein